MTNPITPDTDGVSGSRDVAGVEDKDVEKKYYPKYISLRLTGSVFFADTERIREYET